MDPSRRILAKSGENGGTMAVRTGLESGGPRPTLREFTNLGL